MKIIIKSLSTLIVSKTARNTYAIFFGNLLSAFFSFIFTIILVRNLTLADFGYFSALLSFTLLISDVADLGIGSSLSSFLPQLEKHRIKLLSFLHVAFNLQFLIILIVIVPIYFLAEKISLLLFHNSSFTFLIKLVDLGILVTILGNFIIFTLNARQKFYEAAFISGLSGLLRLSFLFILLFFSIISLKNAVLMQIIAQIILVIIAFFVLKLDFLKIRTSRSDLKRLFLFTIYLGIARGLTAIASRLDVLMLVSLKNATEAGIYSTAAKVISIYPILAGSFSSVLAPRIAGINNKNELNNFLKKTSLATLFLIFTIVIMIIIAQPFIIILFGQKAAPAVVVFKWLLFSMIFFVASIPSVTLSIYYLKKPEILTINSILQLIIVFLGNLFFIPIYGGIGAGISLILAYGITFILTSALALYYYQKQK